MGLTRRRLLVLAGAVPAALVAGRVETVVREAAAQAIAHARPAARGTSASVCARCGAADHTMLDPRCPAAPRVRGT